MSENKDTLLHLPIKKRKPIPDIEYRRYEGELREKIGLFYEHIDAVWGSKLSTTEKFQNGFPMEYFLVAFLEVFDVKLKSTKSLDSYLSWKNSSTTDNNETLTKDKNEN